ncbi:nuclear transport factor 2 family protein [Amycolatopsis sp. H20-H5]|uniref:nuclear transport factor 2 family protein n=1 Tax=Amycolatopsis sp. H20-H5 TaxID=3046309 RepID=UPI002DB5F73B|nr:nuclear transport factor 2 family protein [Amycolatopsis sp. H20-H5]MEC3975744.1 nuclear transport factor 2 family protein [Amycolatopsis sp. H20-H5]
MSTTETTVPNRTGGAADCLQSIVAYHGDIDRGRATRGIRYFADDARFQARGRDLAGRDAILGFLTDREAKTARRTLHVITNPVTTFDSDDDLSIAAVIVLYAMDDSDAYVIENVLDTVHRFTRSAAGWLIVDRTSRRLHPAAPTSRVSA